MPTEPTSERQVVHGVGVCGGGAALDVACAYQHRSKKWDNARKVDPSDAVALVFKS